jgi:hypothetical protein
MIDLELLQVKGSEFLARIKNGKRDRTISGEFVLNQPKFDASVEVLDFVLYTDKDFIKIKPHHWDRFNILSLEDQILGALEILEEMSENEPHFCESCGNKGENNV